MKLSNVSALVGLEQFSQSRFDLQPVRHILHFRYLLLKLLHERIILGFVQLILGLHICIHLSGFPITILSDISCFALHDTVLYLKTYYVNTLAIMGAVHENRRSLLQVEYPHQRLLFRFPMVLLEFFIELIFPAALWPWG
jgi:hypothetical protein